MADRLNAENTRHWTGKPNSLAALLRVDGKTYRVMGRDPQRLPALDQTRPGCTPTRTVYGFAGGGINLELTFFTPALPDDLDVLSRPLTYIEWSVSSADAAEHTASLYFDAGPDLVVNTPDQPALAARYQLDGLPVLRLGSREQAGAGEARRRSADRLGLSVSGRRQERAASRRRPWTATRRAAPSKPPADCPIRTI